MERFRIEELLNLSVLLFARAFLRWVTVPLCWSCCARTFSVRWFVQFKPYLFHSFLLLSFSRFVDFVFKLSYLSTLFIIVFSFLQSRKLSVDNMYGLLRMIVSLDTRPTKLSEEHISNLSNWLFVYLIEAASVCNWLFLNIDNAFSEQRTLFSVPTFI